MFLLVISMEGLITKPRATGKMRGSVLNGAQISQFSPKKGPGKPEPLFNYSATIADSSGLLCSQISSGNALA